jgi:hypothetical protein
MLVYFTDADEETIVAIDQCHGVLWTVVYDSVLDFWSAEHRSADGGPLPAAYLIAGEPGDSCMLFTQPAILRRPPDLAGRARAWPRGC